MDIKKITTDNGRFYEIGEKRYPSITTVLSVGKEESPYLRAWKKRVGEEEAARITKESTDIGTAMHSFFELFLKEETLPQPVTEEEWTGYEMFRAGKTMIRDYVQEVIAQEKIVYSDKLKVAGQFDLLCKNRRGEIVLIDFKSTKRKKSKASADNYRLQTAFYRYCIKETMDIDIHHSALFFVTRDYNAYWMRINNGETNIKELIDIRMEFARIKGF